MPKINKTPTTGIPTFTHDNKVQYDKEIERQRRSKNLSFEKATVRYPDVYERPETTYQQGRIGNLPTSVEPYVERAPKPGTSGVGPIAVPAASGKVKGRR